MKHKVTPKNITKVLVKFNAYVAECLDEPEALKLLCGDFDLFLNELADQDAFGTEGQTDPRGDQRE